MDTYALSSGSCGLQLSYKIGTVAAKTFTTVLTTMEEHETTIMGSRPHWTIMCFGSDPNCSRMGHGSQLMDGIIKFIDESALPAYLACTDDASKPFFEKYGFAREEYHENPTISYMVRQASSGGGGGASAGTKAAPAPAPAPSPAPSSGGAPSAGPGAKKAAAEPEPVVDDDDHDSLDSDDDGSI